ncbi:MAG: hypothetical protein J2P24_10225 [Streptosporangiales bacterium]|nr:hypothetical protein [Streptosporangiales bacterium]MBO0892684.1 hypothetical protein [Acidothermales bacterium]
MKLGLKVRHWPGRIAVGAYILNSGLSKRSADEETAKHLHGAASTAYPMLKRLDAQTFARLLSAGEIAVGAALLLPVVPTVVAGAGLTAFSAGLVGLYLRTPGMRREKSLRPSEQGIALAKDVWMLGMGVGFVVDELTSDDG